MNGITLWMAFVDAVPVVVFLVATLTLLKHWKSEKTDNDIVSYGFFASGTFMLFGGAILKVAWKTLYALNVCDYYTLSESFFPMQTIGFVLLTFGVVGKIAKNPNVFRGIFGSIMLALFSFLVIAFTGSAKEEWVQVGTEVLPYESHMPFLLCTFIGFITFQVLMMILAFKSNKKLYILAFILSAVFMVVEAVVGSMFDGSSGMHWIAQYVHLFAEIALLVGIRGIYCKKK